MNTPTAIQIVTERQMHRPAHTDKNTNTDRNMDMHTDARSAETETCFATQALPAARVPRQGEHAWTRPQFILNQRRHRFSTFASLSLKLPSAYLQNEFNFCL